MTNKIQKQDFRSVHGEMDGLSVGPNRDGIGSPR